MSITKDKKQELIGQFGKNAEDSGATESQIAILTGRINTITDHIKVNKKDHSGRRGLIQLVSKRRKLLDYLKKRNPQGYLEVIKKLGIRK